MHTHGAVGANTRRQQELNGFVGPQPWGAVVRRGEHGLRRDGCGQCVVLRVTHLHRHCGARGLTEVKPCHLNNEAVRGRCGTRGRGNGKDDGRQVIKGTQGHGGGLASNTDHERQVGPHTRGHRHVQLCVGQDGKGCDGVLCVG